MITIKNLTKSFPNVTPFSGIDLEVQKGEVISIIGPSGTGKSTLLRCINRLEEPTTGEIWLDGQSVTDKNADISAIRRKMGMVFQSFNLFAHLTVIENLMLGPVSLLKLSRQEAYDESMRLLRMVGLAEKALSYPDELSGGQKQRVAIARALAMKPEVILFDEPTSALDPTMVGEVLTVIRSLASQGLTMLIVTHEMKFARDVSTRVLYLDEGGIYEDGPPEQIFDAPQRERTRAFVRRLKVLHHEIASPAFDFVQMTSAIEEFGRRMLLPQRQIINLQMLFEEVCVQTVMPRGSAVYPISFTASVSEADGACETEITFGGDAFDLFTANAAELPIQLATKLAKAHHWEYQKKNKLNFTL